MIAALFQLAGSIVLVLIVIFRKDRKIHKYLSPGRVFIKDTVNGSLRQILFETWMIRLGLFWIIIGYGLQILGIDSLCLIDGSWFFKISLMISFSTALSVLSYLISKLVANKNFNKLQPLSKDSDEFLTGDFMLDPNKKLSQKTHKH